MPRKTQFVSDEIIAAAYDLVRKNGWEGLSVKAVAQRIKSSTMPIYSYFQNLEKLKDAVVVKGWEVLMAGETKAYTGDVWVDQSLSYIKFAMAQKRIFYCMFDGRNIELQREMTLKHWDYLLGFLNHYKGFKGLEEEQIFLIRYSRALFTHGLAISATSNWSEFIKIDGMLENLVSAGSRALLEGYKKTYDYRDENIEFLDTNIKDMFQRIKTQSDKN